MKKITTLGSLSAVLLLAGLGIPNPAAAAPAPAAPAQAPASREIKLTGKLLLYPVSKGSVRTGKGKGKETGMLSAHVDGVLVHRLEGDLARTKEDVAWWAYLDMSEYVGKTAVLAISPPDKGAGLALIESSDEERHLLPLYDERMRPQFHHSQKQGWNNDPNGMVYYDGEYHLFWQCNPVGNKWGNMYWGHSTSPDMVHWTEQRRALRPFGGESAAESTANRHPSMANKHCFSGSAHVDVNNTGGWQTGDEKTLVAFFTDTGCGEAMAYSNDRGLNWTYYDKNPVIKHRGRDPKLLWYEPGKHWVAAVYDEKVGRNIAFYSSTNLKDWTLNSHLRGYFECPELFELPVDGDKSNTRWVIFGADARYAIGTFDGKTFTPGHEDKHTLHYGPFYASQCFSNPPDGRVVQIGWSKIAMGGMPFNQAFSLPLNLTLKQTKDGIRMFANPIEELNTLHDGKPSTLANKTAAKDAPVSLAVDGELFDIHVTLKKGDAAQASLFFDDRKAVTYDFATETLDKVPAPLNDGLLKIRVLVDRSIMEIVANDGQSFRTAPNQPATLKTISVQAEGGSVTVESLEIHKMKSIWKK